MNQDSDSGLKRKRTTIDRILECAVTVNWQELTKAQDKSSMRMEYRTGPQNSLEYWKQSTIEHRIGTTFSRGNYSADLVRMLDAVMQHQEDFVAPSRDFPDGLVQIKKPSTTELSTARVEMIAAMDQIGSFATHK